MLLVFLLETCLVSKKKSYFKHPNFKTLVPRDCLPKFVTDKNPYYDHFCQIFISFNKHPKKNPDQNIRDLLSIKGQPIQLIQVVSTQKKVIFQLRQFSTFFHEKVGLIDAKDIDLAQPIWSCI